MDRSSCDRIQTPPMHLAWMVWKLGTKFYLMGFFQRVAPAVITIELMKESVPSHLAGTISGVTNMGVIPRRGRLDAAGTLHHVVVRGIEKRRSFLISEALSLLPGGVRFA